MGTGNSGNYSGTKGASNSATKSNIAENAKALAAKYGLTTHGYFGTKGKNCRIITTGTPVATSTQFYQQIGKGGTTIPLSNGKGTMTVLGDGTRIVHRIVTSTPGSPAVEISISGSPLIKDQKIHFK